MISEFFRGTPRGGHWGGPTPPQPRFGGGANRPTTIEMVGGRTGGRRPLVGGRNRKIFAAPSAPRKKPYIPYYSLFIAFLRTNFQKMGNFNLFFFAAPSAPHIFPYMPEVIAFIIFLITSFTTDENLCINISTGKWFIYIS